MVANGPTTRRRESLNSVASPPTPGLDLNAFILSTLMVEIPSIELCGWKLVLLPGLCHILHPQATHRTHYTCQWANGPTTGRRESLKSVASLPTPGTGLNMFILSALVVEIPSIELCGWKPVILPGLWSILPELYHWCCGELSL